MGTRAASKLTQERMSPIEASGEDDPTSVEEQTADERRKLKPKAKGKGKGKGKSKSTAPTSRLGRGSAVPETEDRGPIQYSDDLIES